MLLLLRRLWQVRAILRELPKHFVTGVISGRSLGKIRTFVDVPGLFYAGSHGFDILAPCHAAGYSASLGVRRWVVRLLTVGRVDCFFFVLVCALCCVVLSHVWALIFPSNIKGGHRFWGQISILFFGTEKKKKNVEKNRGKMCKKKKVWQVFFLFWS